MVEARQGRGGLDFAEADQLFERERDAGSSPGCSILTGGPVTLLLADDGTVPTR
jgi:hypothetical protein